MNKRLLYFNLAIDTNDTSLAFTIDWLKTIGKNFEHVDVISLRVDSEPFVNKNIKIYGLKKSNNKLRKYIYFLKVLRKLTMENDYESCFSHMSPISIVLGYFYLVKNKIKITLWFTHPGPKLGIKKLILYLAFLISKNVLTASENSFPFKGNKVHVIGHAVNLTKFKYEEKITPLNNFLILSRISESKNIEMSIKSFISSNILNSSLDIIGGPLNNNDEIYFQYLKEKYQNKNIKFIGKINYENLPEKIKKYDVNISSAGSGFFDKSVLETISSGIINLYKNKDFNILFENSEYFNFENESQLTEKIISLQNFTNEDIKKTFNSVRKNLELNSLETLNKRIESYL
jgi:hypothetical protein